MGQRTNTPYWGPRKLNFSVLGPTVSKNAVNNAPIRIKGPTKIISKSLQQSSYAAAVVDRSHALNQWFLTGVRLNLWGSVSQPQRFGRGPLKCKHSPRLQSEIGQPTAKRRTRVEVLLSFAAGESSFTLYSSRRLPCIVGL